MSPLSSRDPSSRPIAVRLPADLVAAVDHACAEHDISPSELIRGIVSQWAYGKTQLAGPDEGYAQARDMAVQIAHAAVQQALEALPDSHSGAKQMLEGFRERRKG